MMEIRYTFETILNKFENMEVIGTASNGREGVDRLKEIPVKPDVIIMDIDMPFMNGIEATKEVVKFLPEAKIIIATAHLLKDEFEEALKAGAAGYILKE